MMPGQLLPFALLSSLVFVAACGSDSEVVIAVNTASVGPVNSFGSVIVNDTRWRTDRAEVYVDGARARDDDLQPGQLVRVLGEKEAGQFDGRAVLIESYTAVRGPVSAHGFLLLSGERARPEIVIEVLGQYVILDELVSFGSGISPKSAAGIRVGDIVEVHGYAAQFQDFVPRTAFGGSLEPAKPAILATRIALAAEASPAALSGTISAVDGVGFNIEIDGGHVAYASAALHDFAGAVPAVGDRVFATGGMVADGNAFAATDVYKLKPAGDGAPAGSAVELEAASFGGRQPVPLMIHGVAVDVAAPPIFFPSDAASRRIFRGTLSAADAAAGEFSLMVPTSQRPTQVKGFITDIGREGIEVLGNNWTITSSTRLQERRPGRGNRLNPADLRIGDWVDIQGFSSGDYRLAWNMDREARSDTVVVTDMGGNLQNGRFPLAVLGYDVLVDAETKLRGAPGVFLAADPRDCLMAFWGPHTPNPHSSPYFTGSRVTVEGEWLGDGQVAADVVEVHTCLGL